MVTGPNGNAVAVQNRGHIVGMDVAQGKGNRAPAGGRLQRPVDTNPLNLTELIQSVGGQLDFIYGASRAKDGVPIIALPSMAKKFSRIVPMLKPGAGVVTTRNHVHYIVTEYGIAELYGKSIRQRALSLINIAHPLHREELTKQAKDLHYI